MASAVLHALAIVVAMGVTSSLRMPTPPIPIRIDVSEIREVSSPTPAQAESMPTPQTPPLKRTPPAPTQVNATPVGAIPTPQMVQPQPQTRSEPVVTKQAVVERKMETVTPVVTSASAPPQPAPVLAHPQEALAPPASPMTPLSAAVQKKTAPVMEAPVHQTAPVERGESPAQPMAPAIRSTVAPTQHMTAIPTRPAEERQETAPVMPHLSTQHITDHAPAESTAAAPPIQTNPTPNASATAPAGDILTASTPKSIATSAPPSTGKPDYTWLIEDLSHTIARARKEYPADARLHDLKGKVVVKVWIQEDGTLANPTIATSSGSELIDQNALDLVAKLSPFHLSRPLGAKEKAVKVPISYTLD